MEQKKQRSPPWSDLIPELLAMVFLCLPRRVDRVFFTAVCRAWRTAVQQCRLQLPSPMPWLLIPDGSATRFPCGSEIFHLPDGVRYHISCGEWLLLSRDDDGSCFLMNPFSKATMVLPSLCSYTTYSDSSETIFSDHTDFERMWTNLKDISEIFVLSLVVCSKRLIVAMSVSTIGGGHVGTLALCRPGDAAWSIGTNELCRYLSDIVFFRGKLYAIGGFNIERYDLRAFEIADENGNDELRVSRIECILNGVPITRNRTYLVESRGRLLVILRKINWWLIDSLITWAGSSKFEVFEANIGCMSWTEVRSLGDDLALFVGRGCSRAVCVSPYDLSRDSIFFVDDYPGLGWKKTTTSCGVYDMNDGMVYSALPMVSWMSGVDLPATWLFCQESMTNGLQLTGEHLQEPVESDKEDRQRFLPGGAAGSSAASTTACAEHRSTNK